LVFIIQTILATILILVTAEFTPKSIFLINPNLMLRFFSIPFLLIYYLLYPVVMAIVGLSKFFIVYVLKREYSEARPIFGLTDLNNYIKTHLTVQTDEDKDEVNARIIHNALEFKKVKIRDCMIPRTEIAAVDTEDGMEALKKSFIESGHSKILVYRESIDDIIGYTHSLELFKKPKSIDAILTPIIIVPETELANELLIQFITEHKSIALVVDEFGGTSGIVTMEDIIEEIFGEIQDEHDVEELVEVALNDRTWLMSARLEIDYLNEKYGWGIPDGEYETLGGYILNLTEDIPGEKEIIETGHFLISIESIHDTRIDTVKVERRGDSESE
jgi:CBS domain containing-hemolysin-like protein